MKAYSSSIQKSSISWYHPHYPLSLHLQNSTDTSDRRNVGTVLGMASLGVLGFLTFGITLIGGLAGIIFGGTIGRVIAAKVADMRRKKEIVTQEDLYIMKTRCLAELGIKQKKNAALDLNQFRLCLEKVYNISQYSFCLKILGY